MPLFSPASPEGHRRFLRLPQTRAPPPARRSRPFLSPRCRAPTSPPPAPTRTRAWLPATPTSGLASHNARRPPPGTLLTCPPAHVARPPARGEPCGPQVPACSPPERPSLHAPSSRCSSGERELSHRRAFGELPCLGTGPSPGAERCPPPPSDLVSPSASPPAASPAPAPRPLGPSFPLPRHTPLGPARLPPSPRLHHSAALGGVAASPLGAPVGVPASGLPPRSVELSSARVVRVPR